MEREPTLSVLLHAERIIPLKGNHVRLQLAQFQQSAEGVGHALVREHVLPRGIPVVLNQRPACDPGGILRDLAQHILVRADAPETGHARARDLLL